MPRLIDITTGKPFTRRSALKGLAAIIAAGVSPSVVSASTGGLRRGLGARLGMMGGGGWTNPYVTDGLVAMWDGEWNVGEDKHVDYSREWVDLIGGNVLQSNSSAYTPSFVGNSFNKINGNFFFTGSVPVICSILSQKNFTVEICVGDRPESDCALISIGDATHRLFWQYDSVKGTKYTDIQCLTTTFTPRILIEKSLVQSKYLSCTIGTGDEIINYQNGDFIGSGSFGSLTSYQNTTINIGNLVGLTSYQDSSYKVFCIRIYQKQLSSSERTENYAVDKARFGLT